MAYPDAIFQKGPIADAEACMGEWLWEARPGPVVLHGFFYMLNWPDGEETQRKFRSRCADDVLAHYRYGLDPTLVDIARRTPDRRPKLDVPGTIQRLRCCPAVIYPAVLDIAGDFVCAYQPVPTAAAGELVRITVSNLTRARAN